MCLIAFLSMENAQISYFPSLVMFDWIIFYGINLNGYLLHPQSLCNYAFHQQWWGSLFESSNSVFLRPIFQSVVVVLMNLIPLIYHCRFWILILRSSVLSLFQIWMCMHVWSVVSISKEEGRNLMHILIALKQDTMFTSIFEPKKFIAYLMDMKLMTHH